MQEGWVLVDHFIFFVLFLTPIEEPSLSPFRLFFVCIVGNAQIVFSHTPYHVQVVDDNLGFAKDRTISRLLEMQSDEYLEAHAKAQAPELLMALQERRRQQA